MAERPVFIPSKDAAGYVKEISFQIPWASGFAPVQKQKNIRSLHAAATVAGYSPLLEVSSKSEEKVGRHLSAFHLKVQTSCGEVSLESAFQGSKVFQNGGPYTDLYSVDPKTAKRDPRLKESGRLLKFQFADYEFSLQPSTVFYDWLYLSSVFPHRRWLKTRLDGDVVYAGFTDIEFNPNKSINCQAKSCALFVALMRMNALEEIMSSPDVFSIAMSKHRAGHMEIERSGRLGL